jgi:hypothetical protein
VKPLSSYWAESSHRAIAGAASTEARLAIALTPVRSIIRVIDDSKPPMTVDWCKVGNDSKGKPLAMSYTDFSGSRIAVNPLPIIEGKLSAGAAIDVCAGFAMHEASHAKESRDRWKYLVKEQPMKYPSTPEEAHREVPAFEPMQVACYLWNLAEDIRIEAATSRNWPGFAPYFENLLAYMWGELEDKGDFPTEYGPDLHGKIKTVFLACRFPEWARETLPAEMQPEVEWWHAWHLDYLSGADDVPTSIQRGLDHLAEDPETRKELEAMAGEEAAERERGEKIRAQIDRLMKEGMGGYGVCITDDGEVRPLTKEESEGVDQLVKEGLVHSTPIIKHRGSAKPEIRVRKPVESPSSRRAYIGRPDAATEALRAALVFRPEAAQYEVKLQRRGELDDEELYRFGLDDYRLFSQTVIEDRPDTFLGLLVDMSGSMMSGIDDDDGKTKLDIAQRLAQLFVWATHDMEGVTTGVWGHTGDSSMGRGSDIFRLWEVGDPLRRLGLISALQHGNNYDGYAIAYCVDQIRTREEPQKVLIVLSDGYPAGSDYGGREAQIHMRSVVQWAESQGVTVIQLAIDESLRPTDQAAMFGPSNWLPYTSEKQLPRDLTRVMARFSK